MRNKAKEAPHISVDSRS